MAEDLHKPLTPKELKEKQKNQPPSSPYEPYKSPFPRAPLAKNMFSGNSKEINDVNA